MTGFYYYKLQVALEAQVRPDRRSIALIRESDDLIKEFRKYGAASSLPVVKWVGILTTSLNDTLLTFCNMYELTFD